MLSSDLLEQTRELHHLVDISFGKGTLMHFAIEYLSTHFGNFYTSVTGYFQQVHLTHAIEHKEETLHEIKLVHEMNTK